MAASAGGTSKKISVGARGVQAADEAPTTALPRSVGMAHTRLDEAAGLWALTRPGAAIDVSNDIIPSAQPTLRLQRQTIVYLD